ncbi:DUF4179 domain-containing protein [Paenibacillus sp. GCM10027628]|uniref:DUF4179 domain-containing protein n=1 Tax=Paenibacillus sp. GCM10027628 TaxID=3273413 RepID=UPI00363EA185
MTRQEDEGWESLHILKDEYEEIRIPESLGSYVQRGIQKGAAEQRKLRRNRWAVAIASSILLFMLSGTIRISPAFASWVGSIPGMDRIVKLISQDQSLRLAVEHDFIQPVGISDEHDGIRVTVDGIIVDEVRMNILFTITPLSKEIPIAGLPSNYRLTDGSGAQLQAAIGYGMEPSGGVADQTNGRSIHRRIDVQFIHESEMPQTAVFEIRDKEGQEPWRITFPIDHERFKQMKHTFDLNQTVSLDGQKITFSKVTIYPTRTMVEVTFDEANSKQIFGFRDIRMVNEKGESLTTNMASIVSPDQRILYFESSFFSVPKHLHLEGSLLTALDKDQLEVIIDPVKKEIVKSPDKRLRLTHMDHNDDEMGMFFELDGLEEWDRMAYSLTSNFTDDSGAVYPVGDRRITSAEKQFIYFKIPYASYQGMLHFKLEDYPAPLRQNFRVDIQ